MKPGNDPRARARRAVRALLGAACASLLALGCSGYYPSWHYMPNEEIHALHLGGDRDPDATARVGARIAGILRSEDGGPRRLHTRFEIDDCGKQDLTFKLAQTTATPSGAPPLSPNPSGGDLRVAAGGHVSLELFFDLPDPSTLSNSALESIDLAWTVEIDGAPHTSRATFRRALYSDPGPGYWYGDPYWYGPPYWDDPWYWRHGYWGHSGCIIIERR
jgi:hypothetical protein